MFNRREVLRHPTSLQSLVSSSAVGGVGASNPGLHLQGSQSGRQSRQDDPTLEEPMPSHAARETTTEPQVHENRRQQYCSRSGSSRHSQRRSSHRSLRNGIGSRSSSRRGLCHTRWALLAAFALILVGVIVTSSYAIDRRLAQMPQLLYAGLAFCSIGMCLIVASVSVLVARQLGKQQRSSSRHRAQLEGHQQQQQLGYSHQQQQQQREELLHRAVGSRSGVSGQQQQQQCQRQLRPNVRAQVDSAGRAQSQS